MCADNSATKKEQAQIYTFKHTANGECYTIPFSVCLLSQLTALSSAINNAGLSFGALDLIVEWATYTVTRHLPVSDLLFFGTFFGGVVVVQLS